MMILSDSNLYLSLFLIGFIGSSHCIGMCGGIQQLFQNMAPQHQGQISLYFYNLGRVTSYVFIALITATLVNRFTQQTQSLIPWARTLQIIAGLIMIYLGVSKLIPTKSPKFFQQATQSLWLKIRRLANPILPPKNLKQVYAVGIIWGFIPCSLVYSALAIAVTASQPVNSLLAMLCFGLGTIPALIGIGSLSTYLKQYNNLKPILAFLLIAIGLFTLLMPFIL